jgi:hypothetical protein
MTLEKKLEEKGFFKKLADGCLEMAKNNVEPNKENCLKMFKEKLEEIK